MNVERQTKKEMLYGSIFMIIGILAGLGAIFTDINKYLLLGITAGFLPTGIGTVIIHMRASKKEEYKRIMEIKHEERNEYIRGKAGYMAFWISYWAVFAMIIINYIVELPAQFNMFLLILIMPVTYFFSVYIYNKKY